MRLSTKGRYAVTAMVDIALNSELFARIITDDNMASEWTHLR